MIRKLLIFFLFGAFTDSVCAQTLCATTTNDGNVLLSGLSLQAGMQYTIAYGTEQNNLSQTIISTAPIKIPNTKFDQASTYYFAVQTNGANSEKVAATPVNGTSGKWLDFSNPDKVSATGQSLYGEKTDVGFPYSPDFNMGIGDFTVEAWFKYVASKDSKATNPVLVTFNDDGGRSGFTIGFKSVSKSLWVHIAGIDYSPATPLGVDPFDGFPHHYAISRIDKVIYTYIDGIASVTKIPSSDDLTYPKPDANGFTALTIGNGHFAPSLNFDGKIDEVRLWNKGITADEINKQKDRLLLESEKTGLVANWHFDETSGDIAYDATCNGHNGKWLNFPKAEASQVDFTSNQLKVYAIAGNQRVELHWSKIASHSATSQYTVSYGTDTTANGKLSTVTVTSDTSTIITGLENDKLYFFAVSAGGEQSKFDAAVPRKESGKALELDLFNDQYVQVAANSLFETASYTAELWFKPTFVAGTLGDNPCLLSVRNGQQARYSIHIGANRKSIGFWITPNVPISIKYLIFDFTEDRWYHLAVSDNGTEAKLYIDGKNVGFFGIVHNSETNLNLNLGGSSESKDQFQGKIDEVRIWNKIRSDIEINNSKDSPLRGDEKGLVGLWHLDEPNGDVAYDATPNGLNGKWKNSPTVVASKAMHPYKPTGLAIKNATLTWVANTAVDVKWYRILQKTGEIWETLDSVDGKTLTYSSFTLPTSCDLRYLKVVGVDFAGQVGVVSDSVPLKPAPGVYSILDVSGDSTFCSGGSVRMSTQTKASKYEWYYGNQPLKSGPDNFYTATLSGVYRVIAKRESCSDTSRFVHVKSIVPVASSLKADKPEVCAGDTTTLSVNALNGNSFKFKGNESSYLENTKATLTYNGEITVEFWIKSPKGSTSYMFSYVHPQLNIPLFRISNPSSLTLGVITDISSFKIETFDSKVAIDDNSWHHVAFTFTKGNSNASSNLYVDGKFKASKIFVGSGNANLNIDGKLVIGQNQNGFGAPFTDSFLGELDELRFWIKSLDSNTITNNYNIRLKRDEIGLFVLAHFNEVLGSKIAKEEVNNFDFTISNVDIIEGGGIAGTYPNFNYSWTKNGSTVSLGTTNKLKVTESGEYSINWGGTCSLSKTDSKIINVIPFSPKITNVTNSILDSTICGLPSFTLNASKGDRYKWIQDGVNATVINQAFEISKSGIYKVVVDSSIGSLTCSDTTMPVTITFQANPEKPVFSIDKEYCVGDAIPAIEVKNSTTNSVYISSIDKTTIPNPSTSPISLSGIDPTQAGTYVIGIQALEGICKSEITSADLVIKPIPAQAVISNVLPIEVCQDGVLDPIVFGPARADTFIIKNNSLSKVFKNKTETFTAIDLGLNTNTPSISNFIGVLNLDGCEGEASNEFTVQVFPKATMLKVGYVNDNNKDVCNGSGVGLVASGGNAFQWYREDENGVLYKIVNAKNAVYNAVVAGTYKVVSADVQQLACPSDTASLLVDISGYAKPTISQTKTGDVTLLQTNTSAGKYQWFVNGKLIVGANASSFTTQYSGTYMMKIIYKDYCAAFSNTENVNEGYEPANRMATMVGDTAVYLPEIRWGIGAYPNPFSDKLHVSLPNNSEGMTLTLSDINGRLMYEKQSTQSIVDVETVDLASGMYLLKVQSGGKSEVYLVEKVK